MIINGLYTRISTYYVRNNCRIYLFGDIVKSLNLTVLTVYSYVGTSIKMMTELLNIYINIYIYLYIY